MSDIRIETLGCRLNQIESEAAARFFIDAGFSVDMKSVTNQTEEDSATLLCILNTCTVTQKACKTVLHLAIWHPAILPLTDPVSED